MDAAQPSLIAGSHPHLVVRSRSAFLFLSDLNQAPVRDRGMELAPGQLVPYPKDAETYHSSLGGYRWGSLSLTPDDLDLAANAVLGYEIKAPLVSRLLQPPVQNMSRLLQLHEAAGHLAATAPDILAHPEVARAIEQGLVCALVACLAYDVPTRQSFSREQRLPVMRRLERVLEEKRDQPIYMAEVCAAIGVSDRTLRAHCMEHLRMSPHCYLWLRRMNLAYRALRLADPASRTVTEIATDYGFWELGRFAVAYRQLFGEPPSATLRYSRDRQRVASDATSSSALPILS